MEDEFQHLRTYWRLCFRTFLVWLVIDLMPGLRAFPVAIATINLLGLFLCLPPILDFYARKLMAKRRYALSNFWITPAVMIGEAMNIVPGNPYAKGLPFFLAMQAITLSLLEEASECEQVSRRLLRYYKDKPVHPMRLAHATVVLATALRQQGKYKESESATRDAIEIFEHQPGVKPSSIAASLGDLSVTLACEGKSKEAIELGARALDIMQRASADNPALLGMTINNLAMAYNYAGDNARALELYRKSLKLKLSIFGEQSKEAALAHSNVACALAEMEQYSQALEHGEKAKRIAVDLSLKQTKLWPSVICNCGEIHLGLGRLDEAEQELLEALREWARQKSVKETEEACHYLGKLYREKGDFKTADSYFKKALASREKLLGKTHHRVAQTLEEYAKLMRASNRDRDAKEMEDRASSIRTELSS